MSRGEPWLMFVYLTLMTAVVSMFIDNVTTVLLMIPLTIEASEMLSVNPVAVILGEAVFSNVGGTATLIGDPPNILVGIAADLFFNTFIEHLAIPVALAAEVSLLLSRFIYRSWVKTKPKRIEDLLKIKEKIYKG